MLPPWGGGRVYTESLHEVFLLGESSASSRQWLAKFMRDGDRAKGHLTGTSRGSVSVVSSSWPSPSSISHINLTDDPPDSCL